MKLIDLYEYQFPKIQTVNTSKPPVAHHDDSDRKRHVSKRKDVKHLGSGSFASTYSNPKKTPHEVRKVSQSAVSEEIDGFYFYMLELAKHPDNTNPYFPRFNAIKIYKTPEKKADGVRWGEAEKITYSAQMEKLYNMPDLSPDESNAIMFKILGVNTDESNPSKDSSWLKIVNNISDLITHNDNSHIKDKELLNAAKFIQSVQRKHNLKFDVHWNNVMFRRTSYGPQIVITDPLSYQNKKKTKEEEMPF